MMKKNLFSLLVAGIVSAASFAGLSPDEFRSPPPGARPHTWWHWMNGNVTKDGITADLEAMARVGIGGVQIFDAGLAIPKGPVAFASDAWYDCLAHANREAKRLGLELCIANCSGWTSSAGPWITPELSMKYVTNTTVVVKGGERFVGSLPAPRKTNGFYEDIAVLAFPTPKAKAAWPDFDMQVFRTRGAEVGPVKPPRLSADALPPSACVQKRDVIDLTSSASPAASGTASHPPDLRLEWDAPSTHGSWTVLRIGYMCNGRKNRSASQAGSGLECDKLDAHALDVHFDAYVGEALKRLGKDGAFNNVLLDSYEVRGQNWTRGFEKTFAARMGYSIIGFLPVLAGYPIDDAAATERFLKDFRLVVSEQFVKNYAAQLQKRCNENGLVLSCEPYGNGPFDDLEYARFCDIPMAEFWHPTNECDLAALARDPHRTFMETRWGNRSLGNGKAVSATAHVWGKRIVGAEAFTAYPTACSGRWLQGPFELKLQCDRILADGVNRMIFHRFVHQPWTSPVRCPGMTMAAYGGHFDRTQTWWDHGAKEFFAYISRAQHLLQQGTFVADVLLCTSGEAPDFGTDGEIPRGHDGDRCHPNAIAQCKVENGCVIVPGGVRYRVVGTPPRDALRPEVNAALDRLRKMGAVVVEYGGVEAALRKMDCPPDFICDDSDVTWIHRRVDGDDIYFVAVPNKDAKRVKCSFRASGRTPELWDPMTGEVSDVATEDIVDSGNGQTTLFLNCQPIHSVFVVFRASRQGLTPHPPKDLAPHPSGSDPMFTRSVPIVGSWEVAFREPMATNDIAVAEYTVLESWTKSDNPDIRYFSGTARYSIKFSIPQDGVRPCGGVSDGVRPQCAQDGVRPCGGLSDRIYLDLGNVKNIAEVTVNGRQYPAIWKPPFVVDVTDALVGKMSPCAPVEIEVKVTNYWPNRLIGDARLPDDCEWDDGRRSRGYPLIKSWPDWLKSGRASPTGRHAFSTCRLWAADDQLLESGLLGPVCFRFVSHCAGH
jgi:hypothetical protein